MPTPAEVNEQIREAVVADGLDYGLFADTDLLAVKVPAGNARERSGIVAVECRQLGEDNVIVLLVAPTVGGSSLLGDGALAGGVREVVNGLNENALFGRWVFREEGPRVDLEHELVGDSLSSEGITLVISAMGRGASDLEDFFMKAFPGCEPGMNSHPDFREGNITWA